MKKQIKYPVEFKTEVSDLAIKSGVMVAAVKYGLYRSTVNNWFGKYKKFGISGFSVTRNDTQEKKLDSVIIDKIHDYKLKNPKTTLNGIKENFELDCHISLISRKLGKIKVKQINTQNLPIPFLDKDNRRFLLESLSEIKNSGDVSFNRENSSSLDSGSNRKV